MTAKRDNLFPSASIGRAQGASIVRTPSREALAVHPLLSTGPSAPPLNATADGASSAKYVPYTPRQRPATISSPVQAPPTPSQGSVPGKPPLATLRTATQHIGLEGTSIGWAILEKISYEGDTSDEWSEIWNALTKGRAALLLPSEPVSGHDVITPELVQDHLVLCDLATRENTPVVTLSGLRGQLVNNTLTFRSTLHRTSKQFQSLVAPLVSRAASLDALPPLPVYPPESSYPSFTVSAFDTALPLPLRATKPHLPPRPGTLRGTSTTSSARLSMPFASLFGQRPSTPPPPLPPTTMASPSHDTDSVIDISAFVIDAVLSRTDIATGIISTLKGEIAIALNDYPPWIVERVHTFAIPYLPFVKVPAGKKKLQDIGGNPNRVVYAVNGVLDKPEDLADRFQAFYRATEGELRNGSGHGLDASVQQDREATEEKTMQVDEARIRDVLETIEATLCTLLYDRLFLPSTSDDASHNEALSSRVAALNMLDLGLVHLDVVIGEANDAEVDAVVRTCGQALAQLDAVARSPREKAAVMVSSHKLVVEGLSNIPPIRLKSPDDKEDSSRHPSRRTQDVEHTSPTSTVPAASALGPPSSERTETQGPSISTTHLSTSPEQLSAIERPPNPEPVPPSTSTSSPVSGDVLLPILIFSVVKANPSRLVSHLLFTQRFRNQSFGGEESYCLINLMAVAEFLENIDLTALGLGESAKKVLSTADLTPIPIARPNVPESPIATVALPGGDEQLASLRGRVEQGVDAIAGSANKVISGVVDSSFGVLRAFMPGQKVGGTSVVPSSAPSAMSGSIPGPEAAAESGNTSAGAGETDTGLWGVRPSLGLLRRETGFSIAGLTAAFPGGPGKAKNQSHVEEGQRELAEVSSRPASLRSRKSTHEEGSDETEESSEEGSEEVSGEEDAGEEGEEEEEEEEVHDTRSIKSFESMLSSGRTKRKTSTTPSRRKRLSDLTGRLTHGMAGMSRRVQGGAGDAAHAGSTRPGVPPLSGRLPPPNRRFVECTEQDIRVAEVGELLCEYQRLVEAVRSVGGFQE